MAKVFSFLLLTMILPGAQAQKGKDDGVPDGLKALKHPDPKVRLKSVTLLIDLGSIAKFAIPELKECLKDSEAAVRIKAVECLMGLEPDSTRSLLPVLIEALQVKEADTRIMSAMVVGKMGKFARNAVPALVDCLKEKDLALRVEATLALGEIGPGAKKAIGPLLATLPEEDGDFLEPTVAVTLGRIGADAVTELMDALEHKHEGIRRACCVALGLIGPDAKEAVAALTNRLAEKEPSLRGSAAKALGLIGAPAQGAVAKVAPLLKDEATSVRINASLALWQIDKKTDKIGDLRKVLRDGLQDKSSFIREQACKALNAMGKDGYDSISPLLLYGDADPSVRALCANAMAEGPHSWITVTALPAMMGDEFAEVRLRAARAWAILASKERSMGDLHSRVFERSLKSTQARERLSSVEILGELGKLAVNQTPALMPLLRDGDPAVRKAAAVALKKIDPAAAAKAGVR